MKPRKISAGDSIVARCTRCRELLNHTIVAMVGDKVVRVECNTCRGTHNYHGEKAAKEPPAAKSAPKKVAAAPRKEKKDPGAVDRAEWVSLQATMESDKAAPYDMNGKYQAKSLIMHHVFGVGMVLQQLPPNKIEVLFQEGKKLLRCG